MKIEYTKADEEQLSQMRSCMMEVYPIIKKYQPTIGVNTLIDIISQIIAYQEDYEEFLELTHQSIDEMVKHYRIK